MWKSKTWASQAPSPQVLIEKLEDEVRKTGCQMLAAHILQLKKAWGLACAVPQDAAA